jgi:adenylate kinase family enzyme
MNPVNLIANINHNIKQPQFINTSTKNTYKSETRLYNSSLLNFAGHINQLNLQSAKNSEDEAFEDFLFEFGKLSKEEYDDIIKNHPSFITKADKYIEKYYNGKCMPKDFATIVVKMHNYFNKNYKNDRIISVGTSPATLTEQLEALGHKVVYIPISNMHTVTLNPKFFNSESLRTVLKYAKSKNLNDGKQNLVLDFTMTGTTLSKITNYLREYCKIENSKIRGLSLNVLLDLVLNNTSENQQEIKEEYLNDLFCSNVGTISNVPHYSIFATNSESSKKDNDNKEENYKERFKSFEQYSYPLARAYSLCTMHEVQKILHKKNV